MAFVKYLMFLMGLSALANQATAQYKRKGETLQTRGTNNTSKKKADYSLAQLKGKWQEYERTDRASNLSVPFNDSIQLFFTDSNKVRTRTSVVTSMTMLGEADIDPDNNLTVAADEYTIKSLASGTLVLDDNDKFLHTLRKVDTFWYETLGKNVAKQTDLSKPVKVSLADIMGKWSVYRRKAKPGTTGNIQLIKSLAITTKTGSNTAAGEITFYKNDGLQQLPCTVTLAGDAIKIVADVHVWHMKTYQADASNFVFGSADLMYFSKK